MSFMLAARAPLAAMIQFEPEAQTLPINPSTPAQRMSFMLAAHWAQARLSAVKGSSAKDELRRGQHTTHWATVQWLASRTALTKSKMDFLSGFPAKFRNRIPWFFHDFSRNISVFPGYKYRINMNKKRLLKHRINPCTRGQNGFWQKAEKCVTPFSRLLKEFEGYGFL